MKKRIICLLVLFMCLSTLFAEEKLFDKEASSDDQKLENVTITLTAPLFGIKYEGWNYQWYDFYNQKTVSVKAVREVIKTNPESNKVLKKANFNSVLSICLSTIGIAGFVTAMCTDNEKVKDIASSVGYIGAFSSLIPLYYATSQSQKALDIYNYSVIESDE